MTTADLNTEGRLPVKRESLITEVKDRRWSSMSSASNDDGRGSISYVLTAVLFNTSRTVDYDTGWKAVSGDPSKTVTNGIKIGINVDHEDVTVTIMEICKRPSNENILATQGVHKSKN